MRKLIIFLILLVITSTANAAIPHLINYQGRLTDKDGAPLNGSYQLTFRIYDAETAGNLLWQATHTGIVIQKGIFGVLLGSINDSSYDFTTLAFDKPYFLEIKVGNEVMSPRQRITSSGYAINAENGVPKGAIVMWSGKISDIPEGWALCDGTNGTPDLRDRFIVGAKQDDNEVAKTSITGSLTKSGGSVTITEANLPSHSHGVGTLTVANESAHTHILQSQGGSGSPGLKSLEETVPGGQDYPRWGQSALNSRAGTPTPHTHTLSGNTSAIGSGASYTQPYYALAFIIKL